MNFPEFQDFSTQGYIGGTLSDGPHDSQKPERPHTEGTLSDVLHDLWKPWRPYTAGRPGLGNIPQWYRTDQHIQLLRQVFHY